MSVSTLPSLFLSVYMTLPVTVFLSVPLSPLSLHLWVSVSSKSQFFSLDVSVVFVFLCVCLVDRGGSRMRGLIPSRGPQPLGTPPLLAPYAVPYLAPIWCFPSPSPSVPQFPI